MNFCPCLQKRNLVAGGLAIVAVGLFLSACCTFAPRDEAFERQVRERFEAASGGETIALFDGESLAGWSAHRLGRWYVEDGAIVGWRGLGYLATRYEGFDDFELRLEANINPEGNSGVFFRARHPGWGLRPWPFGYEAQIDHHDPQNRTGAIYDIANASEMLSQDGEWFAMRVRAKGPSIEVAVNGEVVSAVTDDRFTEGFIALQAHDPGSIVRFRNIEITPLGTE